MGRENAVRVTLRTTSWPAWTRWGLAGMSRPPFLRSLRREPATGHEVATRTVGPVDDALDQILGGAGW